MKPRSKPATPNPEWTAATFARARPARDVLPELLPAEAAEANRQVPVFFAHGTVDPVIPIEMASASVERLQALGYPVEWHEYRMPHSVHPQEVADIRDWLVRVLAG